MKRLWVLGVVFTVAMIFFALPNKEIHAEENVWLNEESFSECSVENNSTDDANNRYINTISDYTTFTDYDGSGTLQFYVKLTATFIYDGSSATCITSGASDNILNSDWQCVYLTPGRTGNVAWASFKYVHTPTGFIVEDTIHMSCSAAGSIAKY